MIIFDVYADTSVNLNNPRILWDNIARRAGAAISATSEDASNYPAIAAASPDTYSSWQPAALPARWQIDAGAAVEVDCVGIAAHTLGSTGCRVRVQYSSNGTSWEDACDVYLPSEESPAHDRPIMIAFQAQTKRYWALYVDAVVSPEVQPNIGVIYFGKLLVMPVRVYGGVVPTLLNRETVVRPNRSEQGQFLGRSIQRRGIKFDLHFRHLTASWYRENFDPFALAARKYPFFLAWRPSTFPQDVIYGWTVDDITPKNMGLVDFMDVSLKGLGVNDYE